MKQLTLILFLLISQNSFAQKENLDSLLFANVKANNFEQVKKLIEKEANVNAKDTNNASILMWATYKGDLKLVKYLVNKKADYLQKGVIKLKNGAYYGNLLGIAAGENKLDLLKYFIEELKISVEDNEYDTATKKDNGWNALQWAACNENNQIIEYLLKKGANINANPGTKGRTPLITAIFYKKIEAANLLIKKGADVNKSDTVFGAPPLNYAANIGSLEIAKLLISKGAKIHSVNKNNENAIYYAAGRNHELFQYLLNKGIDVNNKSKYGNLSWHQAAEKGQIETLKFLFNKGTKVDVKTKSGKTALILSVKYKKYEIAKFLIENGADVNTQTDEAWTALHYAARSGNMKLLNLLLENKAKINTQNDKGYTPLILAAYNTNREAIKLLLKNGADANIKNNEGKAAFEVHKKDHNPILFSTVFQNKDYELVELLIKNGADINTLSKGISALHFACYKKDGYKMVKLLIDNGADMNIKIGENKKTPLVLAIVKKNNDIAKLLIESGADINIKLKNDVSALHWAAIEGNIEIVELLIKKGADVNAQTSDTKSTALLIALKKEHYEIAKILIDNGADVNVQKMDCFTALHYATKNGKTSIVKYLLNKGANPNIQTTDVELSGWTPLHYAALKGKTTITKLLLENGANPNIQATNESINGWTALMIAARKNYLTICNLLLNNKANKNIENSKGQKAIDLAKERKHNVIVDFLKNRKKIEKKYAALIAADIGNWEKVKKLIPKQKNINLIYTNGFTLMHFAAASGKLDIVKILLKHKANTNIIDKKIEISPLTIAAYFSYFDIFNLLIENGADINAKNMEGHTVYQMVDYNKDHVLIAAIAAKNYKATKTLIENGADVNIQKEGFFPLLYAAYINNGLDYVKLLIENGANTKMKSKTGLTVLMAAIKSKDNNYETVKYLISKDLDVNVQDKNGKTALSFAIGYKKIDIAKLLIEKGAKPNIKITNGDYKSYTNLMLAALYNQPVICKMLLDKGADKNIKNNKGYTALDIAILAKNQLVIDILK